MEKHALSVLIVLLSIYTGIAGNRLQSQVSTSSNLVSLTSPSDLDSLALVALYNQCNGDNWTKKANWLKGNLDTWQGVTVENGRVDSLDLGDPFISVGLTGQLPSELSNLTEITSINLDNNKLTGNLPENWSTLMKLQDLRLGVNQFAGNLPTSWSSLVQLQVVDLGDNQFEGSLPLSWVTLTNLVQLNLNSNHLTGNLPDNWAALANMQQLWLGNNQLTGTLPDNWSALKKLRDLYLGNNLFTGSLPLSWSILTNLHNLQLNDNKFTGSLPDNWSDLGQLQFLSVGNNQLTGSLPSSWKALVNLKGLLLYNNQLSGSLPESWSALVNLSSLVLNNNQFTGNLPVGWAGLVNLTELYLNSNKLTGSLPDGYSSLVSMLTLQLDNNQLTGIVPASWLALVNLTQLSLSNNQLTGIPIFSTLGKLNELWVQNNVLDFGTIEPNVPGLTGTFNYSPQAPVGLVATLVRKPGEEFRISVNVGGQSNKYQWYKDGTAIPGATSTEFLITSVTTSDTGIYTCQITNTVATKLTLYKNAITLQISASGPVANAGIDQTVNMGSTVILDSSGSSHDAGKTLTYKWTPPSGITLSSATAAKPTFTAPQVTTDTNYTFSLVVNDETSDSPASQVVITVKYFNSNMTPCENDPIRDLYLEINYKPDHLDIRHKLLTCAIPLNPDLTYVWDMGDGTTRYGTVLQHSYSISNDVMSYTLSVTVTNSSGCERTTSRVIEVIPFIPNVFSPNGDGINDVFMPKVKLKIYDRFGTVFYEGTEGWDGTYKGKSVEPDTYFYSIEYSDWKDKLQTRRGFITLVK